MNIIIPAEASLDVYKAAYVIFKKRQLRLCNLEIVYPTRSFVMADNDVVIDVHVSVGAVRNVMKYKGFQDVMNAYGNPIDMKFLEHIPDTMLLCFRNEDRTLLAAELFASFDAFEANLREAMSVPELLSAREIKKAGGCNIVLGTGERFLCSEERILLFKSRQVQYVVFESGGSYGVQRCISQNLPSLSTFAKEYLAEDTTSWFVHRRGHVVVSKAACTPSVSLDELVARLCAYLGHQNIKSGAQPLDLDAKGA